MVRSIVQSHKKTWKDREFILSVGLGMVLLAGSLALNYAAGKYATRQVSNAVSDLLLDHLPFWNIDFIFIQGALLLWFITFCILIARPKRIPFTIKSIALFVCIRSLFITLTHLGPYPHPVLPDARYLVEYFTFTGDLFFSGHTGLPFLLALTFWQNKGMRMLFLATSVFFAAAVLLGHLHYSIDVFAAFFITYSIFHLAKKIFAPDYDLLREA